MREWYDLQIETAPAVEPVVIADLTTNTDFMKGITTDDTVDITLLTDFDIKAARKIAENYTGRAFITTTFKMIMNTQPGKIELPKGQIKSVTTIKTYADDETTTTEDSDYYTVMTGDNGCIFLRQGYTWTVTDRAYRYFEIIYKAGYGDDAADVPAGIKRVIMMIAAWKFENREAEVPKEILKDLDEFVLWRY